MKRKDKIYTDIRNYSKIKWLMARQQMGIGGSDTPTLFGANSFESSGELFYKKCGIIPIRQADTVDTYRGRVMEPIIRYDIWPYWDPDNPGIDAWEDNMNEGKKLRIAKQFNFITQDPRFPWLFANTDGRFPAKLGRPKGILECKAPRYFANVRGGVQRKAYYYIQSQHYMLVMGYEYCEIAIVSDGVPEVLSFYADPEVQAKILEKAHDFWVDVLQVRDEQKKGAGIEDIMAIIHALEPDATDQESWKDFLDENHRAMLAKEESDTEAQGDNDDIALCKEYKSLEEEVKAYTQKKRGVENMIKQRMQRLDANILKLPGDKYSIKWRTRLVVPNIKE